MNNTISRQILLPEFLKSYPHWTDLAQAIDEVFEDTVDKPSNMLSRVREVLHLGLAAQIQILNGDTLAESDFERFEREILIKCLTFVGCPIRNYSIFSDTQLFRLLQHLPTYWYSKGGMNVGEFISFVLGVDVDISNLWTTDYENFYPEGDTHIGLAIYDGGDWYPTSHVRLGYDPFLFTDLTIPNLKKFLDDLLNYNLVLHSIESRAEFPVVQISDNVVDKADFVSSASVALSAYWINYLVISTDLDLEANFILTGEHTPQELPEIEDGTVYVDAVTVDLEFSPESRVAVDADLPASSWSNILSSTEVKITVTNNMTTDLHNVVIPELSIVDMFAGEVNREAIAGVTIPLLAVGDSYTHTVVGVFFTLYLSSLSTYVLPVRIPTRWIRTGDDPSYTNLIARVVPLELSTSPPQQPCDPYFDQVSPLLRFSEPAGATQLVDESNNPGTLVHEPFVKILDKGFEFEGDPNQPIGVEVDTEEPYWSAEFLLSVPSLPSQPDVYGLAYVGVEEALTNPSKNRIQINITPTGKVILHLNDGVSQMNIESLNYVSLIAVNHIMIQRSEDTWWVSVNGKLTPPFTKPMTGLSQRFWLGTGFTTTGLASLPRPLVGVLKEFRATRTLRSTADFFAPTFFPNIDCTDYANNNP